MFHICVVYPTASTLYQVLISAGYEVATTCEDHHIFLRELFDEVMEEETVPEIQRTNLTKVVLHLKTMGVNDVLR